MKAAMRKMLTLVVVLATLLSLWPVTMTGAVNPPPSSEIETEVWLELSCEGGVGGIRNLSPFPGVEMVKIKVDGKVVGSHPVPLEAGQTMEMAVNWAEWGISLPIVEAHTIVVKTNDDQASATVGPCVEPTPPPAPASVVVHKFHDANSNGVQDEGEEHIEGWLIRLYSIDGDLALVGEGTTDEEGLVAFTELPPGRYKVWEEERECWAPITPVGMNQWSGGYYTVVDLGEGQQVAVEFGNVYTCAPPPPPPEPCIDLEKTGPETAEPGETITYHFWVQNCGDVALEGGAQVYDPLFGDEPIWSGNLQPEEVAEFDMTYTLPEDACGNFTNTARAVGHPPDQPDVEDEDSWTVEVVCAPPAAPAIDVEKYISTDGETWLDADTPAEAPQIPLGNDVYFRFLVQNVGDVPLTNVGLTDSVYDLSGCAVPEELDPGASFECIIGPFAAEEGEHVNTATACGDYEGQTYKDTDRAKYYGYFEPAPSIDLEKYVSLLIDGQTTWEDADEPPGPQRIEGSEASFKFELTNDGNVPLTDITLEDSAFNLSGCELPEELAPGNSFECVTGPLTLPPGQHTNTGTAIGFYDGIPYTDTDDANTFVIDLPSSIRVTKSATPEELVEPGGEVMFTVVVENISTADTVTITGLTDDVYGDLNGQGDCSVPQELGPGESYECSFTAEVEGNAGDVFTDTVTATGSDDDGNPVSDSDDATVTITDVPSAIEVTKTAGPTEVAEPGGEVEFTVVVENIGEVDTVTIEELTDDVYGDLDGQGDCEVPQELGPGESYTCSFTADVEGNAGDVHTDTATASGSDDDGNPVSDSDDATVTITDVPSSIEVTKTAEPIEVAEPGGEVEFTVVVENTGEVDTVTIEELTDDVYGDLDGQGDCEVPQTLAPGESYTCSFTAEVEGNAGEVHTDTVTATGSDDDGNPVEDADDATVTITDVPAAIEVTKTAEPTEVAEPGGEVEFTVVVENIGEVDTVTIEELTDDVYGDLDGQGDCEVPQELSPGESYTCSFTAEVEGNAGDVHTDTVTATGTDDDGNPVSDSDDATVTITEGEWDHSSLYFDEDYGCQGDCTEISALVCNGQDSEDMEGPTTWELYWVESGNPKDGVVIASGTIEPLDAGECQILTYNPQDNPNGASGNYMFKAYQRPGHPSTGELWSEACELECEAVVYVVIAVDTEADNNHPMDAYNTVFDTHNYQRPSAFCPSYETKYSADGTSWTAYTDGTVFNFQVKPTGEEESVTAFTCGDNNAYGLDDYHRAVQFTVPDDGFYDVQVQISYVGDPPDTHIYVVPDDGSGNPDVDTHLSEFLVSTATVANGEYNTIAENLYLEGNTPYWWYAERQSWGNNSNQFAVYRGVGGGETTISRVMDENFRTSHTDSFGNPFKMSWFMEMDNFINQGVGEDGTPFDYLTLYNLMVENWGDEIERWGDELAYHHHFMEWGGSSWVRTTDLEGYDWHNEALAYMILDGSFFPTSFRSGWLWSNNQSQSWVEQWMPIDYSNLPGNEYWRTAPSSWFPYHPSESDYQTSGDMDHWIARCDSGPSQGGVNSAFDEAQSTEGPVIYCWYTHKRSNMSGQIASAQGYLDTAAQTYGIQFKYVTAQEALQAIMECDDTTPPALSISGENGAYTISSAEPLWGDHPFIAAKYVGQTSTIYTHTTATPASANTWEVTLPTELTITSPPEQYDLAATAQSESDSHPASHAVDGDTSTYWDSTPQTVPVWIQVDAGEAKEVSKLTIHFWDGDSREYTYYVEASTDGSTWTEIVSSNTVHGLAEHTFDPPLTLRYVRVTVTANSGANDYAHIREIALYGSAEAGTETFYLEQVGAGGIDICGNSSVATISVPSGMDSSSAPTPLQRAAPIAVGGAATTGLLGAAWFLTRRKSLLP